MPLSTAKQAHIDIEVRSIESIVALYRAIYRNSLNLSESSEITEKMGPGTASLGECSPLSSKRFQSPFERSIAKYCGLIMLESLLALYRTSSEEVQHVLKNVYLFRRATLGTEDDNPFSAIQSILVPRLFYIELGLFSKLSYRVYGTHYQQRPLPHLDDLRSMGFLPILNQDFMHAESIWLSPGGYTNAPLVPYKPYPQDPSLLSSAVLRQFVDLLKKQTKQLHTDNYNMVDDICFNKNSKMKRISENIRQVTDALENLLIKMCSDPTYEKTGSSFLVGSLKNKALFFPQSQQNATVANNQDVVSETPSLNKAL